jgi:GNAT superfamily N-acetyltransferase
MTAVITRAGTEISTLTTADVPDVLAMYERCSADTRYRRWHGHASTFPAAYLRDLVTESAEHVGVAARRDGLLVGVASAAAVSADTREIGILVEDGWQRRGVGGALLSALLDRCAGLETRYVRAEVLSGDAGLLEVLRRKGPTTTRLSHGVITAVVRLWA